MCPHSIGLEKLGVIHSEVELRLANRAQAVMAADGFETMRPITRAALSYRRD
jgi:hypothetical protein